MEVIVEKKIDKLLRYQEGLKEEEVLSLARNFLKNPFWLQVFRPGLEIQLMEHYERLRLEPVDEIPTIRAGMDILEMMIRYPEYRLEMAKTEGELEKRPDEKLQPNRSHGVAEREEY